MASREQGTAQRAPRKPRSLFGDLTLALVLLVTVVSGLGSLLNYVYFTRQTQAAQEARAGEYAEYLRDSLEWPLWNIDDELIRKIGDAFASNADMATLTIRDDQDRVVYRHENPELQQRRQRIAIRHRGQAIGSVEFGISPGLYQARDRQLLTASLATMALLVAVLLLATRWILARLLRQPVAALVTATSHMVEGKYQKISLPESYREFATILDGFQAMSDAVANREDSLRRSNRLLASEMAERNRAQEALRSSEQRFAKLMKKVSIPLCYVSEGGVIEGFNDRFDQVFGYTRAEIPTMEAWWRLAYPDPDYRQGAMTTWRDAVRRAAATGEDIPPNEYRVTCRNGEVRIMEISGVVLEDDFLATFVDITARKQAEDALKLASHYSRSLIEASMDPLVTISAEGKITDVNRATEKATGLAREQLIGSDFADYFTEPEKAREGYQLAFSQGFVTDYPLAIRHVSGHVTAVLYNASVFNDEAGNVLGVFAAARDITERLKAETAVLQLSLRNRLILDSAGEGIYGLDNDGRCTFANPAASQALGFGVEELIGQCSHALFHHSRPDGQLYPLEDCPVHGVYRSVAPHRGVDLFWRKDGSSFPVEYVSSPIMERGKITGAVVIFSNITERRLAEEKLQQSENSLAEAQRIAHLGNWELDLVRDRLVWSAEMLRIFGMSLDEFGATYQAFLDRLHPEDRERVNQAYLASLAPDGHFDIEYRILRQSDGQERWIYACCEHARDGEGKVVRSIGTALDITERKQAEQELCRYKDHLEEEVQQRTAELVLARNAAEGANRAKSVFLANMNHELRTPLNAILGFSNLLRKQSGLSSVQCDYLDIIHRSGEHLLTLINDVLEMSKIEAGRVQIDSAPFDLGGLVRDVADMMQVRAQEKGLQLRVEQTSRVPRYIRSDEARLRQVLINLVGNAIKFTREGSVVVHLGVRPETGAERLLIEVEDSGVGIRPEDQPRIFEAFVQLGEDASQKGTGLGLALTRQYVELMGGHVRVDSIPGRGSRFAVDLPLERADVPAGDAPAAQTAREVVGLAPGQPVRRILIVEDQRENQLLLARLMRDLGLEVKIVENGALAVALFQRWRPHLVWMDRRMPVMDGIEATRRIRQLPGGKDVKIVAVTASAMAEQRAEMLAAGMDDAINKPYRFHEIYECLARQLGVAYVYADPAPAASAAPTPALTADRLARLPEPLRHALREALESLESERIDAAIAQVGEHDAELRDQLAQRVENFDYPAILNVL